MTISLLEKVYKKNLKSFSDWLGRHKTIIFPDAK